MRRNGSHAMSVVRHVFAVCGLLLAIPHADAAFVWTNLGTATNSTNPSVWESSSFNVTSLISGASGATLSFDLRNDAGSPGTTTSRVEFGIDGTAYAARFTYLSGDDTSHWRNVVLDLDGLLYVDQFGAWNNHLGSEILGTLYQGAQGSPGVYELSQVPTAVPVPAALPLFLSGLAGMGVVAWRRKKLEA